MKILTKIVLLFFLYSCHFFEKETDQEVIARVGNHFLYKSDVQRLVAEGTSSEDSLLLVKSFIDKWATQHLLKEKSIKNLPQEKIESINELVESYQLDLFINNYLELVANKELNEQISSSELELFFEQNKDNFKLNEELIKLRYLYLDNNINNLSEIKQHLYRFNNEDKNALNDIRMQFKSNMLNDSIWFSAQYIKDEIRLITQENFDELLKKSNRIEVSDSLGIYLIFIKDVLHRNDHAPLSYVKPTLEKIILNSRKLEIIKKIEKDIIQDAIKNNKYEVFQ